MKFHKYSKLKSLICAHIERMHRKLYDNQYRQEYKLKILDQPLIIYYLILHKMVPDFRPYLKMWKKIGIRAYNQRRLSVLNQICIFWNMRKVNTERYSGYLFND